MLLHSVTCAEKIVHGFVGNPHDVFVGLVFECFFQGGKDRESLFFGFIESDGGVESGPLLGGLESLGQFSKCFCFFGIEPEKCTGGSDANDG